MSRVPPTHDEASRAQWRVRRPGDLMRLRRAETADTPFLLTRDAQDIQKIVPLPPAADRMAVGRDDSCDVAVPWDPSVSRLHAELHRIAGSWTIVDDGLSRNGTYLNGRRIASRARLRDGDMVRVGATQIEFRDPEGAVAHESTMVSDASPPVALTSAQRRVLLALARPYAAGRGFAVPASNQEIADELFVTVDAVKAALRVLFHKFGIGDLPQNQKRAKLVERALDLNVISEPELSA